jgi:hypothetical protein
MKSHLNVGALIIRGKLLWNDSTQMTSTQQWLCAGFVVVEGGTFEMSLQDRKRQGFIYIKDNGATHNSTLGNRVFGGVSYGERTPTIDISGHSLRRTWSLLAVPVGSGLNVLTLLHDPVAMGWAAGDRIVVASTTVGTHSQSFSITSLSSEGNRVYIDGSTDQVYGAQYLWASQSSHATLAAEVVNLR